MRFNINNAPEFFVSLIKFLQLSKQFLSKIRDRFFPFAPAKIPAIVKQNFPTHSTLTLRSFLPHSHNGIFAAHVTSHFYKSKNSTCFII